MLHANMANMANMAEVADSPCAIFSTRRDGGGVNALGRGRRAVGAAVTGPATNLPVAGRPPAVAARRHGHKAALGVDVVEALPVKGSHGVKGLRHASDVAKGGGKGGSGPGSGCSEHC